METRAFRVTFIAVTLFDESEWINVACREDFAMIAAPKRYDGFESK